MKPRKVIVTLELLTDRPLGVLRIPAQWSSAISTQFFGSDERIDSWDTVKQVQVNVVKPEKPKVKA